MPPIRSINERPPQLSSELNVPKIATAAVAEPPRPTTTFFTPERVIGMTIFQDKLYVATENGVYVKGGGEAGFFQRLKFEIVEEPGE